MVVSNPSGKGLVDVSGDEQDPLLVDDNPIVEPPPSFSDVPQYELSRLVGSAAGPTPPGFAPYDADYFETNDGNIISHDPHLNSDGEALYRFLLAHADEPPSYRLHCKGTHVEYRTQWVTQNANNGPATSRAETRSETVTDFDFYIAINPPPAVKPIHWSVADMQPAYRGHMVRETESSGNTQRAKRFVERKYLNWVEERMSRGLPPWASNTDGRSEDTSNDGVTALQSSKTVRQWADDYCASQKYLKEFVYEKVLYGWNIQRLERLVRDSIAATTMYNETVEVDFERHGSKIYIRPDNRLSRILSNKWLKFLSMILCVFPFIWLFKRFHPRGGGRWEVCGGAYALKSWEADREDRDVPFDNGDMYAAQARNQKRLVGMREDEWFKKWEATILGSVRGRYQSSTPIFDTNDDTSARDEVFP